RRVLFRSRMFEVAPSCRLEPSGSARSIARAKPAGAVVHGASLGRSDAWIGGRTKSSRGWATSRPLSPSVLLVCELHEQLGIDRLDRAHPRTKFPRSSRTAIRLERREARPPLRSCVIESVSVGGRWRGPPSLAHRRFHPAARELVPLAFGQLVQEDRRAPLARSISAGHGLRKGAG